MRWRWCYEAEDVEIRSVVAVQADGGVVDASPEVPALGAGGAVNSGGKSHCKYLVQVTAITTTGYVEQRGCCETPE